jgi:Zn-dependent peptidase ImmA (M78 family)
MNLPDIAAVVADLRHRFRLPVDPTRYGPVPLDAFFHEMTNPRLTHGTIPDLTRGKVMEHLRDRGMRVADVGDPNEPLAGFIFQSDNAAWIYVSSDRNNPIGRQRFTAAHELGHAVLHRDAMPEQFLADTHQMLSDPDAKLDAKEREANQFAAELLMPEAICRAREAELRQQHGCCPRLVLAYRLAAELLVSREAIRYRLNNLGVGDE